MRPISERQRKNALAQATDLIELLDPIFERNDIDEEQFVQATDLYAQAVIMKARISSMQGRTQ
jgi:hypothetical protein